MTVGNDNSNFSPPRLVLGEKGADEAFIAVGASSVNLSAAGLWLLFRVGIAREAVAAAYRA